VLGGTVAASRQNPETGDSAPPALTARRLVRDPVCGVHVAEELSIPLRDGNEVLHFCSIVCRDKYTSSAKKFAANG
jgi:YHS domain-containing protein